MRAVYVGPVEYDYSQLSCLSASNPSHPGETSREMIRVCGIVCVDGKNLEQQGELRSAFVLARDVRSVGERGVGSPGGRVNRRVPQARGGV